MGFIGEGIRTYLVESLRKIDQMETNLHLYTDKTRIREVINLSMDRIPIFLLVEVILTLLETQVYLVITNQVFWALV